MNEEEQKRLEFKRTFLLQNISDVKKEWYRHDDYREKLRFWFLTVWFGTLAIFLKDESPGFSLYSLLLLETITFYGFEIFYHRISTYRIRRISMMEHWLMQATDEEILGLEGPLARVINLEGNDVLNNNDNGWQVSVLNPNVSALYWMFLVMSVIVEPILKALNA